MLLSFKGKMGIAVKGLYYKPEVFWHCFLLLENRLIAHIGKAALYRAVFLVMGKDTISGSCACNGQASAGRTTVS